MSKTFVWPSVKRWALRSGRDPASAQRLLERRHYTPDLIECSLEDTRETFLRTLHGLLDRGMSRIRKASDARPRRTRAGKAKR